MLVLVVEGCLLFLLKHFLIILMRTVAVKTVLMVARKEKSSRSWLKLLKKQRKKLELNMKSNLLMISTAVPYLFTCTSFQWGKYCVYLCQLHHSRMFLWFTTPLFSQSVEAIITNQPRVIMHIHRYDLHHLLTDWATIVNYWCGDARKKTQTQQFLNRCYFYILNP